MIKLIILDRDGALGQVPEDFVHSAEEWLPQPGALEAVARLNHGGWRVVIASNQSGIGRGLFDMATLNAIHARMHKLLAGAGARVDAVFFCPHAPDDNCTCRKPLPGLYHQIAERYGVPVAGVPAAGDSLRDMQAASAAGCEPHLLLSGQLRGCRNGESGEPLPELPAGTRVHDDLPAFADFILARAAEQEKT